VKRFGKYDLIEPIAVGGMAEVFKARVHGDVGFERTLAIKRILPHLMADADFVSMFVDEAKIAVQLTHSNIAQIHDLGWHDGAYFIALEYVHGRDLRAITMAEHARGGAVPLPIACAVAMKVAEALDYAHRAEGRDGRPLRVIHRDVSPQNLLVSYDGEVKVIDFGLAKAAGRTHHTAAGILKGKLAYLSPEQASSEPVDYRSDIYALGIVLWELLTGQRLFLRDNDVDTVTAVKLAEVPSPRSLASDVPFELDAIAMRALDRSPAQRYQRAQELHDALEAYLYQRGEIITRKRLATYMRELFPEEWMAPNEISEMHEIELIEDEVEDDETREIPEDLRRSLVKSTTPRKLSSAPPMTPPAVRTIAFSDDTDALTNPRGEQQLSTLNLLAHAPYETSEDAEPHTDEVRDELALETFDGPAFDEVLDGEGTTAVGAPPKRDTIPAPGPEKVVATEKHTELDGGGTAVTLITEERTSRVKVDGERDR
jgi:serine/threonine protein kinase